MMITFYRHSVRTKRCGKIDCGANNWGLRTLTDCVKTHIIATELPSYRATNAGPCKSTVGLALSATKS